MWIEPAALPVWASSALSRISTRTAPLATISCASLPETFGTTALAASTSCLAVVGISALPCCVADDTAQSHPLPVEGWLRFAGPSLGCANWDMRVLAGYVDAIAHRAR